jgi:hypothetical protein
MNTNNTPAPRVTRIEIHYEDGAKDTMIPAPRERTEIPLYIWTRSSQMAGFNKNAYTSGAVAIVLFQTALTRRLMKSNPMDKETIALARGFAHVWQDTDYAPKA